jgi:protein TonB
MKRALILDVIFLCSVSSMSAKVPSQLRKPFSKVELLASLRSDQTETPPAKGPTKQDRARASVVPAKLIHQVGPTYPRQAEKAGVRGTVRLRVMIGKDGKVRNITLLSGNPVLVKSAMEAVSKWRYSPCLINGEPAEVPTEVAVVFGPQRPSH